MKKFVLLIVLLVLVAGCTSRTAKTDPNRGVTINTFSVFPGQTRSGNTVLFDLEIENIGGTTARNVRIDLLGVQDRWRNPSSKIPVTDTQQKGPFTLNPPSIDKNLPGDFRAVQWELMTPQISQGINPVLPVEARVTYDYNTSGYIDIFTLTRKELDIRQTTKQPVTNPVVEVNSPGPLKLLVPDRFKANPFIVDTEITDPSVEQQTLRVEFANVGDGFPITSGKTGNLTGTIRITGPGARFDTCFGKISADGKSVTLDSGEVPARIREDGRFLIACNVNITKSAWSDTQPSGWISLQFDLFYTYFVKKEASVQVVGTGR